MKKKLLGLGALLLAVTITSYSVSGTYAKYTSSSDALTDKARVAKWGIDLKANKPFTVKLFEESYTDVKSGSSDLKIIAPGTNGSYTFTIDTANALKATEVAYNVTTTVNIDDQIGQIVYWLKGDTEEDVSTFAKAKAQNVTFYMKEADGVGDTGVKAISELNTAIGEKMTFTYNEDGGAGTSVPTETLYWAWLYDHDSSKETGSDDNDNNAGNGTVDSETVTMTVNVTATQKGDDAAA